LLPRRHHLVFALPPDHVIGVGRILAIREQPLGHRFALGG
jgi:hypothetical protein